MKTEILNFWYAARDNEMFLDLDTPRQLRRALRILRLARMSNRLKVEDCFVYPSSGSGHTHLIVVLMCPLFSEDADLRPQWSLWMGTDPLRVAYSLERTRRGLPSDLLVARQTYHRAPDAECGCAEKHKAERITKHCPALRKLLGNDAAADYFPRVRSERKQLGRIFIASGRVTLSQLKTWRSSTKCPKTSKTISI